MGWRPLLTGERARHLTEAAHDIAGALRGIARSDRDDASLMGGHAGIALFFAYLARSTGDASDERASRRHLELAVDAVAARRMPTDLDAGFTGVAWAVHHLASHVETDGVEEGLATWLGDRGSPPRSRQRFEHLSGLAGLGTYALERRSHPGASRMLLRIIELLAALSEGTSEGITWRSEPFQPPEVEHARAPEPFYNLGVAHGIPGVIAFLGRVSGAGIADVEARRLLDGAVSWLLAHRSSRRDGTDFPAWFSASETSPPNRISWCSGNLGVSVALLLAAREVGERHWDREALALARACAARDIAASKVDQTCLCHGSAGNAHLFNRLYQSTGETCFRDAALGWLDYSLTLRKPGSGLAGFESLDRDENGRGVWVTAPGFLNGIAGVGLAFLAATTSIEPAWDRILAAGLPVVR